MMVMTFTNQEISGTEKTQTSDKFSLRSSHGFPEWLAARGGAVVFTTYQAGKVFFIGLQPDGRLSVFERTFPRCMGMAVSADSRQIYLASEIQIYRLDNVLGPNETSGIYDALYVPRLSWITGKLDIHDVAIGKDGKPVFINTLFGCVATVSDGYSFKPLWMPPFISTLLPEDRCHINGLAMQDGEPRFITAVSRSDVKDGWRDMRADGGIVMDVTSDEIIVSGLSMPHSPRLYAGKLWLVNSGHGRFGYVDRKRGTFEKVAFCPGFARGLAFTDHYAVIGLSRPRDNRAFQGLALAQALARRNADAMCGLQIVDLNTGERIHWLRIEGVVRELYDVAFLPGIKTPSATGFKGEDIKRILSIEPS